MIIINGGKETAINSVVLLTAELQAAPYPACFLLREGTQTGGVQMLPSDPQQYLVSALVGIQSVVTF